MGTYEIFRYALAGFAAYLIGCVATAIYVARAHGIDIRQVGSGNPGGTNVMRALGAKFGVMVMVLDAIKGILGVYAAVLACRIFNADGKLISNYAKCIGGMCVIIGHNWPVFSKFKGGKGVASSLGVFIMLNPWAAGAGLLVHIIILARTKLMSLASLVGFTVALVVTLIMLPKPNFAGAESWVIITGLFLWLACIFQHRTNIVRLISGQEKPVKSGKRK